jgi:hypothetical protein
MTPKSTQHAPTKGEERLLSVNATSNGFLGRNREESKNGLHVAKSNAGRSAVLPDEDSKPDPVIKRPKNKQDRPPMSDSEGDPLNDEDRKPAAKNTSPTPDGVPSTCAGFKRKSTSTRTGSVVSTSGQGIKREPVINAETASTDPSTEQAEDPIPTEAVSNGPNLNPAVTVRRKVAKRTDFLYIAPPPPPNIAVPLPPSPQAEAEEIPARKKPRYGEPLPTVRDDAARKTAFPDLLVDLPTPDTPPSAATVDVSTLRRSRRQTQLPPIEMREAELDDSDAFDDADYVDDDLSGPVPPRFTAVNTSTRRRSSRSVIPTSSTGTPIPPPPPTVNAPTRHRSSRSVIPTSSTGTPISPPVAAAAATTRCQSRRQTQLPSIETSKAQLLDDNGGDDEVVLSDSSWKDRFSELADHHRIHGHCNVPSRYSENTKLGKWVGTQRTQYRFHLEGKTTRMTLSRIQKLESLSFEWSSQGTLWEDRLSELADYRKIYGHCNVPKCKSDCTKLATWVSHQRSNYKLHLEGRTSPMMTLSRIQKLESLGFEWKSPN